MNTTNMGGKSIQQIRVINSLSIISFCSLSVILQGVVVGWSKIYGPLGDFACNTPVMSNVFIEE